VLYLEAKVTIPRKPEIVWAYLTDVSKLPSWVEDLFDAEIVGREELGVGTRVDVARRVKGKRSDATIEVTAFRAPKLLAIETRLRGMLILDRALLEDSSGGTEMRVLTEIAHEGMLASIFARPVGMLGADNRPPPAQAIYQRSVEAFAKLVESSTMTPYR
jgi:uncharacterized protein YndB with AHSA1/START domain